MAKKPTLTTITSGSLSPTVWNTDKTAIEDAFDNTLSRDGSSPNTMEADFDLNSNNILNAGTINASILNLAGQRVGVLGSAFTWQGAWVTATNYVANDIVSNDGNSYIALEDHTSGTFSTDLAANKWEIFVSKGDSGIAPVTVDGSGNLGSVADITLTGDITGTGTATMGSFVGNLTAETVSVVASAPSIVVRDSDGTTQQAVVAQTAGITAVTLRDGTGNGAFKLRGYDGGALTEFLSFNTNGAMGVNNAAYGTSGQYLVSKGTGAPPEWQDLDSLPYLHVRESQSSGVDAGAASATTTNTRTLNTVVTNTISGASVATNQVTLPAGTYRIKASTPAYQTAGFLAVWNNITDAATELLGTAEFSNTAAYAQTRSFLNGEFTIAAQKVFELGTYTTSAKSIDGLGTAVGAGVNEIYSEVEIWKVG